MIQNKNIFKIFKTDSANTKMDNERKEIDYCYENFNGAHVQSSEPKSKTYQTVQGLQTYHETPLLYNYGTTEVPIVDRCFVEFPPVMCNGGIVYQKEEKKSTKPQNNKNPGDEMYVKESYSVMFTFDLQDPDIQKFLPKMDELHRGVAQSLVPWKAKIGLRHLDPKNPEATGLKNPIYYKVNELTNERVVGRNPSLWVKLNHWKNSKTMFTDLNNNPIDWSLLYDVDIKMIPLVNAKQVYSGTKASIQFELVSAIILDIAPAGTKPKQVSTVEKYKQKYSGLADKVSSQLAQLRMEKQDNLDSSHSGNLSPGHAKLPDNEQGRLHQVSVGKTQNSADQLNEFLGAAPVQMPPKIQNSNLSVQTPVQLQIPVMNQSNTSQLQGTAMPVQFVSNMNGAHTTGSQPMLQIQ